MLWAMAWILGGERPRVKEYETSESEIWEGMPTEPAVTHTSISEGHLSWAPGFTQSPAWGVSTSRMSGLV